ncbi:MAG: hypothetical protein GXP03_06205 [Alphaproteobacteria bacterium]|nr:hypothetical protein [Alphaproteobacteria bacterium]
MDTALWQGQRRIPDADRRRGCRGRGPIACPPPGLGHHLLVLAAGVQVHGQRGDPAGREIRPADPRLLLALGWWHGPFDHARNGADGSGGNPCHGHTGACSGPRNAGDCHAFDVHAGYENRFCPAKLPGKHSGCQHGDPVDETGLRAALPAHTYGSGSDTPDADMQSMAERALLGQSVALSGADILGGIGQLECATVFSPVQAVLDNEIGAMLRRFMQPPEISTESLNWKEVSNIRTGGHFLDSSHTLDLCRDQHRPDVFLRMGRDDYEHSDRRTAFDAAREKALALIAAAPEQGVLSEDQRREITALTAAGDKHILALNAAPGAVDVI